MSTAAQQVAKELDALWRKEADAFLAGRSEDIVALGENVIRDILKAELLPYAPIPALSPQPQPMEIATREEVLKEHSRILQVVGAAEKSDAARVQRIRGEAVGVVTKVAGALSGVGFTLLRGVIMGS